jgi:type I restriction enzyme S subunit
MASEWHDMTLGQLTDFLSGGTPSKDVAKYWSGSTPWVSAKDMKQFRLEDTEDHVTEDGVANGTKLVPAGTVLLLARGMTLLNDLPICVLNRPMTFNQDVKALRPKLGTRNEFLPYLLLGNKDRLLKLVDLAGHGTGRLNSDELKALDVVLPPEPEQRAIARILGTLDDKIELNRRMNETLETIARALFKSWFVDFDPVRAKADGRDPGLPQCIADLFPDSFESSELGEIPKGWSVVSLGEVCDVIDCLHSKKPERRDSGKPLLGLSNIKGNGLIDMADTYFIDEAAYAQWISRMEASEGDCVITNVGRVGAVAQMPRGFTAALGRNMTGIRCKGTFPFPTFIIENLLSDAMRDEMSLKTDSGTILDALNVRNIPRLRFVKASPDVLQQFEQLIRPLRARMEEGLAQSRTLAALRDTLLPKLISGAIRVKDTNRIIGNNT